MRQCYQAGDFKAYFVENMKGIGLQTPTGVFESFQRAVRDAAIMLGTIHIIGKGATMAELAGATITLEKLAVLSSLSAAGYTGAVIGSIAVASGRSISCGSRIADMFSFLEQEKLTFPGWRQFYFYSPEIFNNNHPQRRMLGMKIRSFPTHYEYS